MTSTTETTGAGAPGRRRMRLLDRWCRGLARAFTVVLVLLLLFPAVMVITMSFSADSLMRFPPEGWGLVHYETLFSTPKWGEAIWLSIRLSLATALVSVLLAVPVALVLRRTRLPARIRSLIEGAGLIALVLPLAAYAVALYAVFVQFGLLRNFWGLTLASVLISYPLTFLVVQAALSRLPIELELAAITMGASRARAWFTITIRLLLPSIASGGLLAFITAFDEAVFVSFLGGRGLTTLPKAIFDSILWELNPVITAISSLVIIATVLLMVLVNLLQRGRK
ncbi:ABC transporter permease [Leucobacter celer]|uniref:ABC transporter permease n=1 Tax=Leucobacter celer TaxID=668625 RepID=UPI0006A78F8E|nr:ABC transporter permease subunit [Leucobacter celer]